MLGHIIGFFLVALLETSGPNLHRWVLIPGGQDPATVRESLAPGAAITVSTEPLIRREKNGYRPDAGRVSWTAPRPGAAGPSTSSAIRPP